MGLPRETHRPAQERGGGVIGKRRCTAVTLAARPGAINDKSIRRVASVPMQRVAAYSGWDAQPFPGPEGASPVLWSAARLLGAWSGEVRAEVARAGEPVGGEP